MHFMVPVAFMLKAMLYNAVMHNYERHCLPYIDPFQPQVTRSTALVMYR